MADGGAGEKTRWVIRESRPFNTRLSGARVVNKGAGFYPARQSGSPGAVSDAKPRSINFS